MRTYSLKSTRPSHNRRGVAMLLVIISLAMATILATAYLASRDNSAAIGDNVVESAQARWASEVGLEYGEVILQTETDWRNAHTNGLLIDDLAVGEALVDVEFMDAATLLPPTNDTGLVQMRSIASVNGIEQISTAYAQVAPSPTSSPVSVDLGEFAIFVNDEIKVLDNAVIGVWPDALSAGMDERIALGTKNVSAGAIEVSGSSMAMDTTVYHSPGASQYLLSQTSGPFVDSVELPGSVPLPDSPSAPVLGGASMGDLDLSIPMTISHSETYNKIDLNGEVLTLVGDITLHAENNVNIWNGGGIEVAGNVVIITDEKLDIDDGFIEVLPGGRLTLFARKQLNLTDAYIGDIRADRSIIPSVDESLYMNPKKIRIFNDTNGHHWHFHGNSVVKGSLYGPENCIKTHDNSMIFGRVAVDHIDLKDSSALYYDPSLNTGAGFTNPDSRLYTAAGDTTGTSFWTLPSLEPADIAAAAATENMPAESFDSVEGFVSPTPYVSTSGVPTPRIVGVDFDVADIGFDPHNWESMSPDTVENDGFATQAEALAALILSTDTSFFLGYSQASKEEARANMVRIALRAADRINQGDMILAKANLYAIRGQVDGFILPPDVMPSSTERDAIRTAVDILIEQLNQ